MAAHTGIIGNEIADQLAGHAARGHPLHDLTQWIALMDAHAFRAHAAWFWILYSRQFCAWWNDDSLCLPIEAATSPTTDILPCSRQQLVPADKGLLDCIIGTCNVLTLKTATKKRVVEEDLDTGLVGPTWQQIVFAQFRAAKVCIFALQETRVRKICHQLEDYLIYKGNATPQGHHGVLVALSTSIPYGSYCDASGKKKMLYFAKKDISVICTGARFVLLRICTDWVHFVIIAAHAPHSGNPIADIEHWWTSLVAQIPPRLAGWPVLLLADANAKVGADTCHSIGDHGAEIGDEKAIPFTSFVRGMDLWLPSTFQCHSGPTGTWLHPSGKWLRNDYIGLPNRWILRSCASWISDDIDVALQREDHRAALVSITMNIERASHRRPQRTHKFDVDTADLRALRFAIPGGPSLDVHSHALLLQQQIAACMPQRPPQGPIKQKISMFSATWELVLQKRQWRQTLWEASDLQRSTLAQAFFSLWRQSTTSPTMVEYEDTARGYDALLIDQDHVIAKAYHEFRLLGRLVTQASRADDVSFFQNLMKEGAMHLAPAESKQLWKTIKRALPKYQQRRQGIDPLRLMHLEDAWNPHFEALEAGCLITPEALLTEGQCQHVNKRQQQPPDSENLPTLFDLEKVLRGNRPGRATGHDPFTSELYHRHAAALAEHAYPLLLKTWVWGEEPIQFKGGPLALIPKRPQPQEVQHFRGILLLPTLAKGFHALMRKEIITLLQHQRLPGQLGGFRQQEVLFGSQALRVLGRAAHQVHVSMGVLFVDLSTAFHCLIREMVVGISDIRKFHYVLDTLQNAHCPEASLHIGRTLPCLLQELNAPPHLIRLLQSVHDSTWMMINDTEFIRTHKGTRPGSPVADAIFHYIMFDVSRTLQTFLREKGHTAFIQQMVGMEVDMVIWSDDLAIPVLAATADALVPALLDLLDFVRHEFAQRGFQVNLAKGKTGIVATFCGQGAAEQRRQFQLVPQPGLHHQFQDGTNSFVHLMPAYRHLGTLYTSDQQLDAEIAYRIGTATSAFDQIKRRLLTNRHLPESLRLQLFQSLVLSKLYFSMGSWHTPTGRQILRLKTTVVRMLRKILALTPGSASAARIFTAANMLEPRARLAVERLLYAQRLFHHGPAFLQLNLHAEDALHPQSWLAGLRSDLVWLHGVDLSPDPMLLDGDMTNLIDMWQGDSGRWKRRIRRAALRHVFQENMILDAQKWHAEIFGVLRGALFTFDPDPALLHVPEQQFDCPDCHRQFTTPQGVHVHRRKMHGVFCPEHHLLDSATCPACLTYLWSTQRLQQHLAYMPRDGSPNACFAYLQQIGYAVSYAAESLPKAMKGQTRFDALPVAGPLNAGLPAQQRQAAALLEQAQQLRAMYNDYVEPADPVRAGLRMGDLLTAVSQRWFDDFCAHGRKFHPADRLQDRWIDVIGKIPQEFEAWAIRTFLLWGKHVLPDIIANLWDGELEYYYDSEYADFVFDLDEYHLAERIMKLERRARLLRDPAPLPEAHRPVHPPQANAQPRSVPMMRVPRLFEDQEEWQADLLRVKWHDLPPDPAIPMVPDLAPRPSFVIVHLFAGRRRETDLHSWLADWSVRANVELKILSLDTAISPVLGNLDQRSESWQTLQSLYLQGRIAATISGHPCETYSSARWHPPPEGADQGKWPRPLRTALQLFGIDHRTLKELRQTRAGTAFFLQTLWTLACHVAFGGLFVEEHPGIPLQEIHPSVWRSALSKLFRQHPDVVLHEIAQWKFGAATVKPTGLMTLRLPFFIRDLFSQADETAVRPKAHAIGVDATGAFRTACHKEYPPRLSAGIACAVAHQLQRNIRARSVRTTDGPATSLVQWIHDVAHECSHIRSEATWLPDYQG